MRPNSPPTLTRPISSTWNTVLLVVALAAVPALADSKSKKPPPPVGGSESAATAISGSASESASRSTSVAGSHAGAELDANLHNSVTFAPEITISTPEGPNSAREAPVTLTAEGDRIDVAPQTTVEGDKITIGGNSSEYNEAARTAIAGYGNTTASCFRTFGLGGSSRSSSWSLGLPLKDDDCALGEDAAQAFMMGNELAAWRMYCAQSNVQKVYGWSRWNRREDKVTRETASEKCLDEAGVWVVIRQTNMSLQAINDQIATLEGRNSELVAALEAQRAELTRVAELAHAPSPPPEPREVVVYETVAAEVTIPAAGLAGPAGEVESKVAEKCPPDDPTIAAAICDGVPTLNPNRLRPPPPTEDPGSESG